MTHRGNGGGGDDGGGDHRGGGDVVGCFPKVCDNLHIEVILKSFPRVSTRGSLQTRKNFVE